MTFRIARPHLSDLVLRSTGRRLHPELFASLGSLSLATSEWSVKLQLCTAGHLAECRYRDLSLTEVMAERQQSFPEFGRLFEQKLRGCRTQTVRLGPLRYTVSCQMEQLEPEIFLEQHDELSFDCLHAGLGRIFPGPNRLLPGPVSVLNGELTRDSVLIHAFHTFPEHNAVVKTQSLLEQM